MKTSLLRKVVALFVAMMMLVPMVAMADDAEYGELSVSDIKVNYMGTEYDFSGLTASIIAGMDAANKDAVLGLSVDTPNTTDGNLVVELGETEATVLIADQLVSIPYDRVGEVLAKFGVDVHEDYADISDYMSNMWTYMAKADDEEDTEDTSAVDDLELGDLDLTQVEADMEAIWQNVTTTEGEYTIHDVTYTGTTATIELDAETATKLYTDLMMAIYGSDKVRAAFETVDFSLDSVEGLATIEGTLDMSQIYSVLLDSIQKISMPEGIKMTVFQADGDTEATAVVVNRFSIDFTEYAKTAMTGMGEDVENTEITDLVLDLAIDFDCVDDNHVDMDVYAYKNGAENACAVVSLTAEGDDDNGDVTLTMSVDPAAADEEGDAATVTMTYAKATTDTAASGVVTIGATSGETDMGTLTFAYGREDKGEGEDTTSISVIANTTDMENVTLFALDYTVKATESESETRNDVTFNMNLADVLTVSGTLTDVDTAMTEAVLLSTTGSDVLNLADATDDDLNTLFTNVQTALINVVTDAMNVPGVAALIDEDTETTEDTQKLA